MGDNTANLYNGQAYTLTPHPMPTVAINTATSPILNTSYLPPNEKFGAVNGQKVDAATRRPTHIRSSSYGDYGVTSPESAIPQTPYSNTNNLRPPRNPFADPIR